VTGPGLRVIRGLAAGALALLTAACSSSSSGNTNYSQFYQILRQSVSASFGKARITREQAAAIPYATLGYSLDGGNQGLLVLGTDSGGELLWTSSAHVVIVTRDGRIVRTLGLGHDLSGLTPRSNMIIPPPAAAIHEPFTTARLEDFPELNLYGVLVTCRAHLVGRQSITILGQAIPTFRVDEVCNSRTPDWSFTDSFWVDGDNGLVWRSRQHVHPKGGTVETEIFRPPG
jgi:hypothetical protein